MFVVCCPLCAFLYAVVWLMFDVCRLFVVACSLVVVVDCALFDFRCVRCVDCCCAACCVCCLLFVGWCLLCVVWRLLLVVCRSLLIVVCWLLFMVCCVLSAVWCLLCVGCCLLFNAAVVGHVLLVV